MRTVPDGWAEIVAGPHHLIVEVDSWLGDVTLATDIDVESGTVTVDGLALIQGRLDMVVAGEEWIPASFDAPLAPYGQELQVRAGVTTLDGTTGAALDIGRFRVETVDIEDGPDGLGIRVAGGDRGAMYSDAGFVNPWPILAGTNVVDAIIAMALDVKPDLEIVDTSTSFTLPGVVWAEGDNRWQRMQEMAASAGMWCRFDGVGRLVIEPVPVVNDVAAAELVEGEGGTLVRLARNLSRVGRPNGIVVTGENTSLAVPARGVAFDLDAASPTYWFGRYGQTLARYGSALASTTAQATAEAQGRLATELGITSKVTCSAVPNYALEPLDALLIRNLLLGVDSLHAADRVTLPLAPEPTMDVDTRLRQVVPA